MEIKDSGQRREFGGPDGPVRDCSEHKGRFDLMPLNVVAKMLDDGFVGCIANFQASGSTIYLYEALDCIREEFFGDDEATMMLEVAKHFEDGCKKYGERNWEKGSGIPTFSYVDSMLRHYFKAWAGWEDEPHARAIVWNLMCCIHTVDHIQSEHPPEGEHNEVVCDKCGSTLNKGNKGYYFQKDGKIQKMCESCYKDLNARLP